MKRLIAGLALALSFGAVEAYALNVDLACPASVKVNASLPVTVYLSNWNMAPVTVNRGMAFLVGNSTNNTMASVGVWGPFLRNGFGSKTVPGVDQINWTPGSLPGFNAVIHTAVPASLSGKMAIAGLDFLDSAGRSVGGGTCMVNVVP